MRTLGVLLFPNFELLDVFGPLEMFGNLPDKMKIILVAEKKGLIKSTQGPSIMPDTDLQSAPPLDLLLIPGGLGIRQEVDNKTLLAWIKQRSLSAEITLSVCTGAALLAKTGLLDHRKATSNKEALSWVMQQGPHVLWVKKARWVDDGNIITSSGVAAGIDMSLYVILRLYGEQSREKIAKMSEYVFSKNPADDPFS